MRTETGGGGDRQTGRAETGRGGSRQQRGERDVIREIYSSGCSREPLSYPPPSVPPSLPRTRGNVEENAALRSPFSSTLSLQNPQLKCRYDAPLDLVLFGQLLPNLWPGRDTQRRWRVTTEAYQVGKQQKSSVLPPPLPCRFGDAGWFLVSFTSSRILPQVTPYTLLALPHQLLPTSSSETTHHEFYAA